MIKAGDRMTLNAGYDTLTNKPVMPGLVPGIHVFPAFRKQDVDGRNKSGHDEMRHRE
jgi:hypothetical protein